MGLAPHITKQLLPPLTFIQAPRLWGVVPPFCVGLRSCLVMVVRACLFAGLRGGVCSQGLSCGFASRLFAGVLWMLRVFVRRVVVVVAVLSCVCGWGCGVAFLRVSGSAASSLGLRLFAGVFAV